MNLRYERSMTLFPRGGALCQQLRGIACIGPRPRESPEGISVSFTKLCARLKQELSTISLPAALCVLMSHSTHCSRSRERNIHPACHERLSWQLSYRSLKFSNQYELYVIVGSR